MINTSLIGMRWFKTPEEYLAEYEPTRETIDLVPGQGKRCPKCGNTNPQKLSTVNYQKHNFRSGLKPLAPGDRWLCKRWSCGHTWPMEFQQKTIELTPEQYVFGRIRSLYLGTQTMLSLGGTPAGFTEVRGPGMWGALGLVEAFSSNMETAKDGMLLGGLTMYQQHRQQQQAKTEVLMFESEAQRAWDMAREYFRVPEREAMAAIDAENVRVREVARVMAQEMVAAMKGTDD